MALVSYAVTFNVLGNAPFKFFHEIEVTYSTRKIEESPKGEIS
jgi:hypothetical protein